MATVATKQRPSAAIDKKPLLGCVCPLLADGTGDVKAARPVRSTLDVKGALGDGANISRNIMVLQPVLGAFVQEGVAKPSLRYKNGRLESANGDASGTSFDILSALNVDKGLMKPGSRRGLQKQKATNHGHVGSNAVRLQRPAPRGGGSSDTGSLITRVPKKRLGALHKTSKE